MSFFMASPFLTALGWALLNSVWQFAVAGSIYWLVTMCLKNLTAAARHAIALGLLFSGTLIFLINLSWKYYSYPAGSEDILNSGFVIASDSWYNVWHRSQQFINSIMPYGSLLYLISVAALFIKFCIFVQNANRLCTRGIQKMDAGWRIYTRNLAEQLGISRQVKAVLSMQVDTPQVIGVLKPVILVPFACLTNLTTEQLEAVLLHELVHIKRNDYLVNLFIASAEILFFFNPFVKQLINAIRKEREYSCDDMVVQFQYQPQQYAAALLTLEKNRTAPVTFGIAAGGKDRKQLLARVKRIVGIKDNRQDFSQLGAYLAAALLLGFIAFVNPAKVAVDKLEPVLAEYAVKEAGRQYIPEGQTFFTNNKTIKPLLKATHPHNKNVARVILVNNDNEDAVDNTPREDVIPAETQGQELSEENIQTAAAKETRDFSLPENEMAAAPAPELAAVTPYVPASSFSYQFIQDSSRPKAKGETYNEHAAHEALIKAKKAMEAINWQKIEKSLKYPKRDLAKLKLEITGELARLNWQQINKDAQVELNLDQAGKLKEVMEQEQVIKRYSQTQAYYEAVQKQLLEQEQLIKANDLQMQKTQQAVEQQQKKIKLEMKKRRIIYI